MTDSQPPGSKPTSSQPSGKPKPKRTIDPQLYAQLKAEAKAPYRGLRQFVYVSCALSGLVGGVIFLAQIIAGRDVEAALPNFALQAGVVALMVWLFRLEQQANRKSVEKEKLSKS